MWKTAIIGILFIGLLCLGHAAQAGFVITSAIVEFKSDGPRQQGIAVVPLCKQDHQI